MANQLPSLILIQPLQAGRLVGPLPVQNIIDGVDQGVCYSHNGTLVLQLGTQLLVAGLELRSLAVGSSPTALIEHGAKVGIPLGGSPTGPLAGALPVAGALSGPGTQMRRTGESLHVWPDFSQR